MSTDRGDESVAAAARAMRGRRFKEAIDLLESRLADVPGDLEAMLQLGICHLLSRSERAFLKIHDRTRAMVEAAGELPERVARLWAHYRSLVRKVTAAGLVMGSATLSSCDRWSAHRYSGGVFQEPAPRPTTERPADEDSAKADAAEKDTAKKDALDDGSDTAKPEPPRPISSHRYSGGVYRPPRPKE